MPIEWIRELCPEIAEWQAELIAKHIEERIATEREACAKLCLEEAPSLDGQLCAEAIRARGDV